MKVQRLQHVNGHNKVSSTIDYQALFQTQELKRLCT